jgi:hypothetical protein
LFQLTCSDAGADNWAEVDGVGGISVNLTIKKVTFTVDPPGGQ